MNISNVYRYKLESFLNTRGCLQDLSPFYYKEDEQDLYLLAMKNDRGRLQSLSRWHDVFSIRRLANWLNKLGYSADDVYFINILLSRLGYLFDIDNRERLDKDIFILYYTLQLVSLKGSIMSDKEKHQNYMLRFLCFELGIEHECYSKLKIADNCIFFETENLGIIPVKEIVSTIFQFFDVDEKNEKELLAGIVNFQLSSLDFICEDDDELFRINFNDTNEYLIYPDEFMSTYMKDKKVVFQAISDSFNEYQSSYNLLISNFIIINYAYYILQSRPKCLLALQKYIADDRLFSQIVTTLAYRKVGITHAGIEKLGLGDFVKPGLNERTRLFNLIYAK